LTLAETSASCINLAQSCSERVAHVIGLIFQMKGEPPNGVRKAFHSIQNRRIDCEQGLSSKRIPLGNGACFLQRLYALVSSQ
jgi:hypothetical protein